MVILLVTASVLDPRVSTYMVSCFPYRFCSSNFLSNSSSAQEISLGKELLFPSCDPEEELLLGVVAATSNSELTSVMAEE